MEVPRALPVGLHCSAGELFIYFSDLDMTDEMDQSQVEAYWGILLSILTSLDRSGVFLDLFGCKDSVRDMGEDNRLESLKWLEP